MQIQHVKWKFFLVAFLLLENYQRLLQKLRKPTNTLKRPKKLEILQINLGYMCNQVCSHCHVDAGPDRKEIMTKETMDTVFGSH